MRQPSDTALEGQSFAQMCRDLKRQQAARCFTRAIQYNNLAHNSLLGGRKVCFRFKTRLIEKTIELAPQVLYVDDFRLEGGGIIGITMPGVGRLHVKLGSLGEDSRAFVWTQICNQCAGPATPAA